MHSGQNLTMTSTSSDTPNNDHSAIAVLDGEPPFYDSLHTGYIVSLASKLDATTSYEGAVTEHLRMSGVYWSLTALSILCPVEKMDELMGVTSAIGNSARPAILDWLFKCFDNRTGGFGGNVGHDGHLLYTLSALQILALVDRLDDDRLEKEAITKFVASLQQPDGSFAGDEWGEIDTRFTYCALSCLSLLGRLDQVDVDHAARYIIKCRNLDGGFGCIIGAESHAGQVFCCIGALAIAQSLHLLDEDNESNADLLGWWLAERQCDSGGLNGRPEKQADVCYSWWILSALSILGRVSWISKNKLAGFILKCQDDDDGGIADRPEDMADVFHTFFGIAGLSLLGHLHSSDLAKTSYRSIDPVYALPTDVVQRLNLQGQIIRRTDEPLDERLSHYDVLS